ncbi:signaling protein [Idiomarina sp.]|uniref:signaling protein n=1 Tax=Idiomarina sp. TaxID=1874361 RepID=UPI002E9ACF3B|nr:signaling protein [Pseudomonadota bacterium]
MPISRRLLPIIIALALIGLLFLSWTPNWNETTFVRSTKPYVSINYESKTDETVVNQVVEDLRNRFDVRHEWHIESLENAEYAIRIEVAKVDDSLTLQADISQSGSPLDRVLVRGPEGVKTELAGRLVSLVTDEVSAAHQASHPEARDY